MKQVEFPTEPSWIRIYERAQQMCDGYGYKDVIPTNEMILQSIDIETNLITSGGAIYSPYVMLHTNN